MSMSLEDAAVPREPRPAPNIPDSVFAQFSMKGKVVAITGAADGIGFAVAEAVAEAGADVALWYNSNPIAVERAKDLEKRFKIKAKAYQIEISEPANAENGVDDVVRDFGKLDVFVANAGMAMSKTSAEQTIEEYKRQMAVNGTLSVQSTAYDHLLTRKQSTESSTAPNTLGWSSKSKVLET
jgi:sorbose reductase